MDPTDDLYAVLGVTPKATQAEIQAAFKKRARELHPDVNKAPDAEDRFKALSSAYEVLKNEEKRKRYDRLGPAGRRRPPPREQHRARAERPPGVEDLDFDFENPFDFVLKRSQSKSGRPKAKEREVKLSIPLEDAYKGTTLNITLEAPAAAGKKDQQRFKIRIPPGAKEGDRLKLKEQSLVVILSIEPHPRFELDGRNVSTTIDIAPWEAALGADVELPAPGGVVKVRVPAGSSSGQKLRLRGQGLPTKPGKDGDPGDLFVKLKIVVPKTSSEREKELWKELAEVTRFDPRKS